MKYIFIADNVSKKYGKKYALKNLSLKIPQGSVYGLVGKNGAGKTTLIRIITGLQDVSEGSYELFFKKNSDKDICRVREHIGAVVEIPALISDMTAEENLRHQAILKGVSSFDFIPKLIEYVGLQNAGKKKVRSYSLGMKQRLGIAIALTGMPDFLILDEPVNGLDPQGIAEIRKLLIKLNKEKNITVLISSHILSELSKLATYYGFIDNGSLIKEISADELSKEMQKKTRIKVSDIKIFKLCADMLNLQYKIISCDEADITGEIDITGLVMMLAGKGCDVVSITENKESLESYYVNLLGGVKNA